MSNAWDMAKQMAERHSSSNFVRLANDGDKVIGVFVGEPFSREVVWTGEKYLDVKNPEAAKYLKKGRTASVRVAMNFYILAEQVVRVYEMGAVVFPPVPAFYSRADSIEALVDHTVQRVLDLFGLHSQRLARWEGLKAAPARPNPDLPED